MGVPLTLGVEEELHLIDMATFRLAGRAPALLAQLPAEHFSFELQRTTVETNTAVCQTLAELRADIAGRRQQLMSVASDEGIGIAAVGTVPLSTAGDFELTSSGRFDPFPGMRAIRLARLGSFAAMMTGIPSASSTFFTYSTTRVSLPGGSVVSI